MTSTFKTVCKIAFFLWNSFKKKKKVWGKMNRMDESSKFFELFLSTEVGARYILNTNVVIEL